MFLLSCTSLFAVILWPPNQPLCFFIELGLCPLQPALCNNTLNVCASLVNLGREI